MQTMQTQKKKTKRFPAFYPFNKVLTFVLANLLLSLIILVAFMGNPFKSVPYFFISLGWAYAICATQWLGHGLIFSYLDRKIDWIEQPVKRALAGLAALVVYSAIAFYLIQTLFIYLVSGRMPTISWLWILGNVLLPVGISFVITMIFTAIGFFRAWKTSFKRAERLNAEMMAYKYEVLRNQINPHFLFNSFNVLTDLVYENQNAAVKFIQQLSHLFRYVLESRDKELVSLSEEIAFVKSFAFLLQTRFKNKLLINIDVDELNAEMIVPVSIQMLIENAVKHNEVSDAYPLKIDIRKNGDYIEVSNSLKAKMAEEESTNLGLKNLQQQFAFFSNKEIKIEKTATDFTAKLPLIKTEKI
jgi:sensor histidine kinase YesM